MYVRRSHGALALAGTVLVGLLLVGSAAGSAGAASPPAECSNPPAVEVDQSDPDFTTITISLSCEGEALFHRIVAATVGGVEILRIDTLTDVVAEATHTTSVKLPKAQVCITDGSTGEQTCIPS